MNIDQQHANTRTTLVDREHLALVPLENEQDIRFAPQKINVARDDSIGINQQDKRKENITKTSS